MFGKKEETKTESTSNNSGRSEFELFIGMILLGIGLYILSSRIIVNNNWYVYRFWNMDISSGAVTIPLILGFIWLVINPKSFLAKIVTLLSAIFLVVSIILSVRFTFQSTSLFVYLLIFALVSIGAGLILKNYFKKG